MEAEFASLLIIACGAFLCPLLSAVFPNKIFPETVFLLVFGMVTGPHVLGLVELSGPIELLSELGLAGLFLLAGYEIEPKEISGKGGRHAFATWAASFALALALAIPLGVFRGNLAAGLAAAIVLTTTAFGTLVPILKDRHLDGTLVGRLVVEYGVWGELGPVVAMALLLGTRSTGATLLVLAGFMVVAVLAGVLSGRLKRAGSRLGAFLSENSDTNSQMSVRGVVVLLVGLVTLAALLKLDVVLGAFAAGFVLRAGSSETDENLERKLNAICYGFFVPLFFIVSGAGIDPAGVLKEPVVLVVFILALVAVRAVPIYVSLSLRKDTRCMEPGSKASVALYCTTALPLVVAVASVAASSGAISQEVASTLIAAGGITVLLMPLLASVAMYAIDTDLAGAACEIYRHPSQTKDILHEHSRRERTHHVLNGRKNGR